MELLGLTSAWPLSINHRTIDLIIAGLLDSINPIDIMAFFLTLVSPPNDPFWNVD